MYLELVHQEMVSHRHPKEYEKTKEPDFGTYHHSTSAGSKKTREVLKTMFTDVFASLPRRRDDRLQILDIGCGLGFLSCLCAGFYKNAQITGIDTFKHVSIKRSSLEKAKKNARILGFSDRIDFKKADVFTFIPTKKFDMIVSNLVFHNFGKMRFKAYSCLSSWIHNRSFIVIGDLFFSRTTDIAKLVREFGIIKEITTPTRGLKQYSLLVMSTNTRI